jgi:hypothetical protein
MATHRGTDPHAQRGISISFVGRIAITQAASTGERLPGEGRVDDCTGENPKGTRPYLHLLIHDGPNPQGFGIDHLYSEELVVVAIVGGDAGERPAF